MLAVEFYAKYCKSATTETALRGLLEQVINQYCGVEKPNQEDLAYFITRLEELNQVGATAKGGVQSRSFNTSYLAFINKLDITSLLGLMTDFDIEKMRSLYCKVDFKHTKLLMKSFIEHRLEENVVAFEAQLYGSGNKYKGDGEVKPVDVETSQGRAKLASMGFGSFDLPEAFSENSN